MSDKKEQKKVSRRSILKGIAATAGAAVASVGFPMIAKAQGPISWRWQSTWPTKDIFHEYALDYAKKVNDMTGGDLKIEVLPAGAVVPAFGLLDAVSKGTLDGGHGVIVYHYGKQHAMALFGSSPAFGMDANMKSGLVQIRRRQGIARQDLRVHRRERRFVSLRTDGDTTFWLVQEANHQGRRHERNEVPHRRTFR